MDSNGLKWTQMDSLHFGGIQGIRVPRVNRKSFIENETIFTYSLFLVYYLDTPRYPDTKCITPINKKNGIFLYIFTSDTKYLPVQKKQNSYEKGISRSILTLSSLDYLSSYL